MMLYRFLSLVFIPVFALCFQAPAQKNNLRIRVMSYNIRHASPPSAPSKIDLDTIAGIIKKQNPDILALQEVDVKTHRSGLSVDEANQLGSRTGMHAYFGKAIAFDGGEYGVAILSKYPVDTTILYRLPTIGDSEARVLLVANIRVENKTIAFACTHLDAGEEDEIRLLQVKTIGEIQKGIKYPLILAGDLNAEAGGPVISYIDTIFKRSCTSNCPLTIPNDKPVSTIDYVAYRKTDPFKVVSHKVLNETYASDHLPLVAELEIKW
jgi:endonuclease/exonuclease/phosphatase family metal-dependent hydrolase